jgi:cytochrome c-type biogenesis protein CcmH
MRQGNSDAQIRDYLVARYGEFVLLQAARSRARRGCSGSGRRCCCWLAGFVVARVVRRHAGSDVDPRTDDAQEW